MKLSRRERAVLGALARQGSWPQRTTTGWTGEAAQADWVPDSRKVLAQLASQGLVVDESRPSMVATGQRVVMTKASRYSITDRGRAALGR
ncbi:hypothetical protein SEA_BIPPER_109 [Mycobacterium phage Bipper]|uniref:Uncharacterized protein n=1 Tax=Mycobacterium phage Bipper TaxID=1805457 RepID=A0A142F2N7_9CAUD|nr:hypothetical protein KCH39_gp068 [Mycobacterium phage Bipper]AMQ67044.1 hypothetical protein SEA_BIPPER_109 [Mycobacterium phage Bipper]